MRCFQDEESLSRNFALAGNGLSGMTPSFLSVSFYLLFAFVAVALVLSQRGSAYFRLFSRGLCLRLLASCFLFGALSVAMLCCCPVTPAASFASTYLIEDKYIILIEATILQLQHMYKNLQKMLTI